MVILIWLVIRKFFLCNITNPGTVDFDEILDDEKFISIEKIKTIGSTYMAASGINPLENEADPYSHLCDLVDFGFEMKRKLDDINQHSFNQFQLRIGLPSNFITIMKKIFTN